MWLFLLFLAVPLIEIALFIQIGGLIGLWPTLLVVILTALAGTWLVRSQGAMALERLRMSMATLNDPSEPLADGAMILFAGALLLTPGFFTDAVGLALLVPGVRRIVFQRLRARVRMQAFVMGQGNPSARPTEGPAGPMRPTDRAPSDRIIDGEYEDVSPPVKPTHRPSGWTRH